MSRPATVGPTTRLESAVYEGVIGHERRAPVAHRFSYRVAMVFVELAEIDQLCARHRLWSARRWAPVRFERSDFLGDPAVPLDQAVRDLVERETGARPAGPVFLLAHLRTWGWLFNPISCYFCYDESGSEVQWLVAEVTNTPWHERHAYVVGPPGEHLVKKALHVSPFMGMDQTYRIGYGAPGERLTIGIEVLDDAGPRAGEPRLVAEMALHRQPASRRSMGRMIWRHPAMTIRVSAAIYRQALSLKLKGARFYGHPRRQERPGGARSQGAVGDERLPAG